jgi:dephospho-CoA kinase
MKHSQSNSHKSILITGISGSGKSTICRELKRRGYKAYDIERIRPLFSMVHKESGKVVRAWDNRDFDLIKQMDWICDKRKLARLIRTHKRGTVFYCGTASNIDELRSLFDRVLLLRCSPSVLRERLRTRTTNDFARDPRVQRWVLRSKNKWENHLRGDVAVVIDANQSLAKTTEDVLKEALRTTSATAVSL